MTSFPPNSVIRHDSGSVILDSSGVLVGARWSKSIPNRIGLELLSIYNQMESHRLFLVRGKQVANVCANFVVSGLKEDQNTKLKMSHAPKSERTALMEMEMRSKLQALFMRNIYPTIKCEFGWLFEPVNHWLHNSKVELYAHWVSGVTAGKLFWPRSHVDPDVWYTVLVCIDYGRGIMSGGDFDFATVGHVLECHHCDVLIYNPQIHHGTTKFELYPNDRESGQIFFAIFMKKQVLHADLLSQAMAKRHGVQAIVNLYN